jgi:hypothetical protein
MTVQCAVQCRIVQYCTSKEESKLPAFTARSPSNSGLVLDRTRLRGGGRGEEEKERGKEEKRREKKVKERRRRE